jgi:radical SAM protein with 4Fe4S-binding SPASM domain
MIDYAKKSGAAVNCATNFTRVRDRHREIVESGIDQLKVSIDAARADTYFAIRGEDAWDHILDNIREVNRWKKELGSTTPSIRFNFALQSYNYEQVPDLIRLAHAHGVDGIYIQYLEYVDADDRKGMLTGTMTEEGLRAKLKEAEALAAELGIITNLEIWWRDWDIFWNKMQPIAQFEPNCKQCYFPWFSAWIGADGWVRPCPIMPWTHDEGRMGHLSKQSFGEIWNSPKYRALRAALARGERPTRSCKTCVPQSLKNILFLRTKLLPDNKKPESKKT